MGLLKWLRGLGEPTPLKIEVPELQHEGGSNFVPEPQAEPKRDYSKNVPKGVVKDAVHSYLRANPLGTAYQIATALGLNVGSVRSVLKNKRRYDVAGKLPAPNGIGCPHYIYSIKRRTPRFTAPEPVVTQTRAVAKEVQDQIDLGYKIVEWIRDSGTRQYIRAISQQFNITPREAVLALNATGGAAKLFGNPATGSQMSWGLPDTTYPPVGNDEINRVLGLAQFESKPVTITKHSSPKKSATTPRAMRDFIISNPGLTAREIGAKMGYSPHPRSVPPGVCLMLQKAGQQFNVFREGRGGKREPFKYYAAL